MGLLSFISDVLQNMNSEPSNSNSQTSRSYNKLYNTAEAFDPQLNENEIIVSVGECTIEYPGEG